MWPLALNQLLGLKQPWAVRAEPVNSQHTESWIMTARTYSLDEILEARGKLAHLEATDIDDVTWLARIATLLDLGLTSGNAAVTREQTTILKYRALGWEPMDVADLATIADQPKTRQQPAESKGRKTQ